MDNRFTFIIGGARSGKTAFALSCAEKLKGTKTYIATGGAFDAEMSERIKRHKLERGNEWATIEEPLDVVKALAGLNPSGAVLIDCITLWLNNFIWKGLSDEAILGEVKRLAEFCPSCGKNVFAVSNEVGGGIVPEHPVARRFRDLSGAANGRLAAFADEVYLMTAGIPLKIK
ncbi:MAG: bifunctional adenosylcobinamide kinase/adenosylcobinamide-phosphate guanylyltransferase [Deltaproteobacteria bacterium]|nr:bifunctional adenosylcobinamide kinase/adenosylcobinamide-phosphate guanylyltransferase [Deltaproteobacteria bacterium]